MPAARSHAVTVRRPVANRAPCSSRVRRGADRWSRAATREEIQADNWAGRCENGMAGSLTRDWLTKGHRGQGAGLFPPTCVIHHTAVRRAEVHLEIPLFGFSPTVSRKVQTSVTAQTSQIAR